MIPKLHLSRKKAGALVKALSTNILSLGYYGQGRGLLSRKPTQGRSNQTRAHALASGILVHRRQANLSHPSSRVQMATQIAQHFVLRRGRYQYSFRTPLAFKADPRAIKILRALARYMRIGEEASVDVRRARDGLQAGQVLRTGRMDGE